MLGNRAYYANVKMLKSKLLTWTTKVYKTCIRPIVTYAAETWNISVNDARKLRCFERKVLRRIFGPIKENDT